MKKRPDYLLKLAALAYPLLMPLTALAETTPAGKPPPVTFKELSKGIVIQPEPWYMTAFSTIGWAGGIAFIVAALVRLVQSFLIKDDPTLKNFFRRTAFAYVIVGFVSMAGPFFSPALGLAGFLLAVALAYMIGGKKAKR